MTLITGILHHQIEGQRYAYTDKGLVSITEDEAEVIIHFCYTHNLIASILRDDDDKVIAMYLLQAADLHEALGLDAERVALEETLWDFQAQTRGY